MAIVTMEDLLNRAAEFEHKLERCFAELRDQSENNGVRLIVYYLARHRRHLDQALAEQDSAAVARIKKVRVKYDIDFRPERDFVAMHSQPTDVTSEELQNSAIGYDEQLIALYRSMLEQPLGEEATALVEALVRLEEKDVVMLKKMLAMNYF